MTDRNPWTDPRKGDIVYSQGLGGVVVVGVGPKMVLFQNTVAALLGGNANGRMRRNVWAMHGDEKYAPKVRHLAD
jgi:hypothetical protein